MGQRFGLNAGSRGERGGEGVAALPPSPLLLAGRPTLKPIMSTVQEPLFSSDFDKFAEQLTLGQNGIPPFF